MLRFLLPLFLWVLVCVQSARATTPPLPRALWIWDATTITDATKRDAAFSLCVRHGISTLFISTGSVFAPDAGNRPPVSRAQMGQFNIAAGALGIAVHALDGDPSHTLPSNHARIAARYAEALDFNLNQAPAARLGGFQWNIEPHGLAQWRNDSASQPGLLFDLLTVARTFRDMNAAASVKVPLSFAIPFWYDDAARSLVFDGANRPPAFHFFHLLNGQPGSTLALMSYRDTVSGSNSTLSITADERAYAAAFTPGVRIWIGQETGPFDPPNITFAQEGPAALDAAVKQLSAALANEPVVAGVAIHQIIYLRNMLEAQPRLGDRRVGFARTDLATGGGEFTLQFTRASRDICYLETTSDLGAESWRAMAVYHPALLSWTPTEHAPEGLVISEALAPGGMVNVSTSWPDDAGAVRRFYRVRAE